MCIRFYIFWWCFFVDATQYVYVSEIFPNHLRPHGVAFGLSAFYLASEVTLVAAPVGKSCHQSVFPWKGQAVQSILTVCCSSKRDRLEILPCADRTQLLLHHHSVLLIPRDERQNLGGNW
jgi:hypothetical protein